MIVYAYPTNYSGSDFGDLQIFQFGRYKLVHIEDKAVVPIDVAMLCALAKQTGAQFLLIDPEEISEAGPVFFDTRIAA